LSDESGRHPELVKYLLGELPEEERDRLESEYLANPQLHEQLLATEDELIYAYVRGQLSFDRRASFERLFLESEDRRSRLDFARALTRHIEGTPRTIFDEPAADIVPPIPGDGLASSERRISILNPWKRIVFGVLAASVLGLFVVAGIMTNWFRSRSVAGPGAQATAPPVLNPRPEPPAASGFPPFKQPEKLHVDQAASTAPEADVSPDNNRNAGLTDFNAGGKSTSFRPVPFPSNPFQSPLTTVFSLDDWLKTPGWNRNGQILERKGGEFVLASPVFSSARIVFSIYALKAKRLEWVAGYRDPQNYYLFEVDDKNFYRSEFMENKRSEPVKVPHGLDLKSYMGFALTISSRGIQSEVARDQRWQVIDNWDIPGGPGRGKFGFHIAGKDEIGLGDFKLTGQLVPVSSLIVQGALPGTRVAVGGETAATVGSYALRVPLQTPDTYTVTLSKDGYKPRTLTGNVVAGESWTIGPPQSHLEAISGTIVFKKQQPTRGIRLTIHQIKGVSLELPTIYEETPNELVLPIGSYNFVLEAQGYLPLTLASVSIVEGQRLSMPVSLDPR